MAPALAWTHGSAFVPPPPGFGGNPNVTITAINTAGGISMSRTSGQLPAFFQASASAITATGTTQPYEDLEYSWSISRAGGTVAAENFTNPAVYPYTTGGPSVNANTDQTGPDAAFVCRVADTYTVTLTIRGANGAGFTTATSTATFTATAFTAAHEWWCDSVGGSDSNNGTSSGTPFQTINAAKTAWSAVSPAGVSPSNIAIHLKRGSNFVGQTLGFSGASSLDQVRFDAYSTGADPIINQDGTANNAAVGFNTGPGSGSGGYSLTDIVVSNIQCVTSGTNTFGNAAGFIGANFDPAAVYHDFYWDNCTVSTTLNIAGQDVFALSPQNDPAVANCVRAGTWNMSVTSPLAPFAGNRMSMSFLGWSQWFFIMGGTIVGAGSDNSRDHHIYPGIGDNFLCRWINFGATTNTGSGPTKQSCINGDYTNYTSAIILDGSITTGVFTVNTLFGGTPPIQVGMTLYCVNFNTAVPPGVTITMQLTGTPGGIGTYQLSALTLTTGTAIYVGSVSVHFVHYFCIDSCYFSGCEVASDFSDGFNNATAVQWVDVVSQKCAHSNLGQGGYPPNCLLRGTFRDHFVWGSDAGWFLPSLSGTGGAALCTGSMRYQVYRNKIYQSSATASAIVMLPTTNTITATKPLVSTDNQIEDTRTGASCNIMDMGPSAQFTTAIVDRNNYLCPNATSGGTNSSQFNRISGSNLTFTSWQALGFDPNSTATTAAFPTWIDPANGHFT
jgi:hypothetical protein